MNNYSATTVDAFDAKNMTIAEQQQHGFMMGAPSEIMRKLEMKQRALTPGSPGDRGRNQMEGENIVDVMSKRYNEAGEMLHKYTASNRIQALKAYER